jgi:hypothetical protein
VAVCVWPVCREADPEEGANDHCTATFNAKVPVCACRCPSVPPPKRNASAWDRRNQEDERRLLPRGQSERKQQSPRREAPAFGASEPGRVIAT